MEFEKKILSREIQQFLYGSGLTVGSAESCTGGRIAESIIAVPGASTYFKGGVISYTNEVKENLLGVDHNLLEEKTAVCEEVAKEMVKGAIKALNVDFAIASTGTAGPGGGTAAIPVGTIWLACGNAENIVTMKLTEDYGRDINLAIATSKALQMFIDYLKEMRGETENLHDFRPRQIEFNRLNLTYTMMSKRKLLALVEEKFVSGWDDPRMPTLSGMRRRGYSPESIRKFIDSIGYTKFDALNDMALLEAAVREDLNKRALRVSAVLNPVKLVITNYPEGQTEEMEAINNPENEADGTHTITFSRNLWIERDDFMEDAPKKFFRMTPGKEVRLKNAYIVKCTGCTKDAEGNIVEIQAEYDPISKSGLEGANRKVKGTLHWVSADHCHKAQVRVYDRLFCVENPSADERDFRELLNPESLKTIENCYVENFAADCKPGQYLQFQRIGYFMADLDSTAENLVFNKTVGLKDAWAKQKK